MSYALIIVDTTKGFCDKRFPLGTVPGADKVGPNINGFVRKLRNSTAALQVIDCVLKTNDTHFEGEYKYSPEAAVFPFHQGWGTEEQDYTFDSELLANTLPVYEMRKNKFDMWALDSIVGVPAEELVFTGPDEVQAYENLFKVRLPVVGERYQDRDDFFADLKKRGVTTLVICGVATDYCVYCAMVGALENGFEVILLEDLAAGIFAPEIPGGTGRYDTTSYQGVKTLEELVANRPILQQAAREGRFEAMTSDAYLQRIN